jgi:membrane protein DedA with SNARE-associated domain
MAGDDPTLDASTRRRNPSRRAVAAVTLPLVAMVVMGYIGDALAPSLVDTHPAWLIALNARNRNLILVTNYLDAWTFYSIGIVRLLLSDPLFFILGYWYGDAAVAWMERRTRTWGQLARQAEGWFSKAAYPIVFIAPNNFICLFAGAAGMPIRAFFAVNVAGTVFRLWLIRRFGEAFESPIDDLVGWIGEYRIPLLILSVVLVVISISLEAKRGETEVTALTRLEDEIDEIEDEIDHGEHGDGPDAAEVAGAEVAGTAGAEGAADTPDGPGARPPEARDEPDG